MKRTLIFIFVIVMLAVGWSAAWYFIAGKVETVIDEGQSTLSQRGQTFDCENQDLSGYPFRISLTCSQSGFRDADSGFSIDAGAIRTASQIYQPGKAVVELNGPAILHLPIGEVFDLDWNSLRASVKADLSGPDRFSLVGKEFTLEPRDNRYDGFKARKVQLHSRKFEANDVDFALSGEDFVSSQNRWPAFNLAANLRINDAFDALLRKPDVLKLARERGLQGHLTELNYELVDGGGVSLTGPYEVTRNGFLSGTFKIEVLKLAKLVAGLEKAMPQSTKLLHQIGQAASLLGGGNGAGSVKLTITVRDGNASLGIIPIGQIPPLF